MIKTNYVFVSLRELKIEENMNIKFNKEVMMVLNRIIFFFVSEKVVYVLTLM